MDGRNLFELLGLLSVGTFIGSLLLVPWLISRLSPDFFIHHRQAVEQRKKRHPVVMLLMWGLRNGVGLVLAAAGIAMLVLPGQGIITLLIGIVLMDFPGKHHLIERCLQWEKVRQSLNWIRRKAGKPEFTFRQGSDW